MTKIIQQKNNVDTIDKIFFSENDTLEYKIKEQSGQSANVYFVKQDPQIAALMCSKCREIIESRVGAVIFGSSWFHQECWNANVMEDGA